MLCPVSHVCQVLLVKGFGIKPSWGFPKGKINKDEAEVACAIREVGNKVIRAALTLKVYEEVGYDMSSLVKEENYVETVAREQRVKLYIVAGVPEDTIFETHTRKEISVCIDKAHHGLVIIGDSMASHSRYPL